MHQGDFVQPDGSAVVSFVNISALRVQDGGEYSCKATNDVGVIEHTARIGEWMGFYVEDSKFPPQLDVGSKPYLDFLLQM